jgi:hypothetical protein
MAGEARVLEAGYRLLDAVSQALADSAYDRWWEPLSVAWRALEAALARRAFLDDERADSLRGEALVDGSIRAAESLLAANSDAERAQAVAAADRFVRDLADDDGYGGSRLAP